MKGNIQVYTGNGKGKTTAAFGLGCFIVNSPTDDDIKSARKGLDEMRKIIQNYRKGIEARKGIEY